MDEKLKEKVIHRDTQVVDVLWFENTLYTWDLNQYQIEAIYRSLDVAGLVLVPRRVLLED